MNSHGDSPPAPDIHQARFEACFRDHYASLLAFALRRLPRREAAEDAVSEIFAVAWRRRDAIPDPAGPWLYAVALRVLANQRRSDQRRQALDDRIAAETEAVPSPMGPGESLIQRRDFAAAFAELTERERESLRLIAWDGLSTREAARAIGCSAAAFRVRAHRARRKLAKHLGAAGHSALEPRPTPTCPAEEIS
jgi:RNA polymerase sigma factor (sigma-70 family)